MATLGTIDLGYTKEDIEGGAAFPLLSPSSQTLAYTVGNQGIVCLEQGNPYAVIRIPCSGCSPNQVLSECRPLLEQALDELSVTAHLNLAIHPDLYEYLVWWIKPSDRRIIRYVSTTINRISASAHIKMTDSHGNVIHESIDAPIVDCYSPSLRYWRWSKLSANVFDAFRNMYLALENELSAIHPKREKKEDEWIEGAISDFVKMSPSGVLSTVCGKQSQESWFKTRVYEGVRVKIFHAKDGYNRLMPGSDKDEDLVRLELPIVTCMVQEAWRVRRLVRLPTKGIITNDALQIWAKRISEYCTLAVAGPSYDHKVNSSETIMSMKSKPIVRNRAPWLAGAEGSCPVSALSAVLPLQHVFIMDGSTAIKDAPLGVPLNLTGFDEFQAQIAVQLRNGES